MAFGFAELGLSSVDLWAMTPRELAAAAGYGTGASARLEASGLQNLMARYPDHS
ncbi:MAG: phage tail assembly chaperone [Rhizobiales bacterium]|nr:phage tail assembly chaperone [Hyphomicrobiales bacterium]